jgi:hypothetical protein
LFSKDQSASRALLLSLSAEILFSQGKILAAQFIFLSYGKGRLSKHRVFTPRDFFAHFCKAPI